METRRLYYEDCAIKEFAATVVSCRETEEGFLVTLDATAFYPEGGGQPCDLGSLAEAKVLAVREAGDQVEHLCDRALPQGQRVTGRIDWERRFDLMQQHTGEHMVSGIIHQMFGYHNVGFHMGADVITIDFDGPIPMEALESIELQANRAVYEDLQVVCSYPSQEELAVLSYRSKKQLPWPVRIVQISGIDTCACCGVHVQSTGQIGVIKLLSCVKFHQGVRMELVCGGRAFRLLQQVYEQNRQVSQAFSAKLLQTGAAAQRMNEALAAEKFRATGLEKELFRQIAEGFNGQGDVVYFTHALSPAALRELTEQIAARCGGMAAVFAGEDHQHNVCIIGQEASVSRMGLELKEHLQARGGGKAGFFQGSVHASRQEICSYLGAE